VLYKYFPSSRYSFIADRLVRFTQPGDFNDPFELHPSFDLMSKADLAKLPAAPGHEADGRMRILTPEALEKMFVAILPGLRKQMAQHAGHEGAYALDNNRMAQQTLDAKFGILSLTERPDSCVMWAHYAENHRGFVVQFDDSHPFFSPTEVDGQSLGLQRVEYSPDRPVLSCSSINSPVLYYRKSPEWGYEQEWRLLKTLSTATTVKSGVEHPICLFEVPTDAIKGIVLGHAIPHEQRVQLFSMIQDNLGHSTIFQTALSKETYALEIHPPLDGKVPPGALSGRVCEAR
jgi:Protein of unknown function (DUF2971)